MHLEVVIVWIRSNIFVVRNVRRVLDTIDSEGEGSNLNEKGQGWSNYDSKYRKQLLNK
jgi:hypothetical protein